MNKPFLVSEKTRSGELVARVLTGAWRLLPPPLDLSTEELATITPLLLSMGAGMAAVRRFRKR